MNNPVTFTFNTSLARRVVCAMLAALLCIASLPIFGDQHASAQQLASRSIQMSDASTSGNVNITSGVGSGVGVTYRVSFTSKVRANSLIIDFCKEAPIINDTCNAPTGFDASSSSLSGVTGKVSAANNWTRTASAGQVKLANTTSSGGSADSMSQTGTQLVPVSQTQVFDITGITNPNVSACTVSGTPNCSFYARIYTYDNNSWGTYSSAVLAGNYVDYGGIALSTTTVITITARVQESLTFCVAASDPATWLTPVGSGAAYDCSTSEVAAAPPTLTLGHGSPTLILDSNSADTAPMWSSLSTNATSGAVINLVNSNVTCGGLSADNGTTCAIPAVNSGSATTGSANAIEANAGTAAFGMFAGNVASATSTTASSVGTVTPNAPYHTSGHAKRQVAADPDTYYGMDTTTAQVNGNTPSGTPGNVKTTFGSIVASTSSPVYRAYNMYVFAATAALTTPAGIYTANLSMIATGTF